MTQRSVAQLKEQAGENATSPDFSAVNIFYSSVKDTASSQVCIDTNRTAPHQAGTFMEPC